MRCLNSTNWNAKAFVTEVPLLFVREVLSDDKD